MPALIDMSLFKAALATTSPPWKGLQNKQDEAHSAFTSSIMANQQTDAALGAALSPIFSAAGGVLSGLAQGGVQNLFGTGAAGAAGATGSFLGSGGPTTQSLYPGLGSQMAQTSAAAESMRATMGF